MPHHDLVVIGTGSGNTFLDERFADLDVALVEHGERRGTCLDRKSGAEGKSVAPGGRRII